MRMLTALAAIWLCFCSEGEARVVRDGVALDPTAKVSVAILEAAVAALERHPEARRDRLAIVDFGRPSTVERLFLVDLRTGAVDAFLTAHGKGSDRDHDGFAESFSDQPGGNGSTLGAFLALGRYQGAHGLSLRLRGMDPGNRNAEARAIVIHAAPYMDPAWRAAHGKPGRSFGCFTVETAEIQKVVSALEGGALLYAGR